MYVGELKRAKGVREFVDAILGLDGPVMGVLVGDGPERGYGTDDSRAAQRIEYRGAQPHEDVVRYMSAADVLVLPSYSEGLPTVLVEAGSLGLPVIASSVGGIPELLGTDRGRMLPEISATSVAAALTEFADDRPGAHEAASRLRQVVRRDYDVDVNAAELLQSYRSIAADFPAADKGPIVPRLTRGDTVRV